MPALFLFCLFVAPLAPDRAQLPPTPPSDIRGTVATAGGTVRLSGVLVQVFAPDSTAPVATSSTDETGAFVLGRLPARTYRLEAALPGFVPVVREVTTTPGGTLHLSVELTIEVTSTRVDVQGTSPRGAAAAPTPSFTMSSALLDLAPLSGDQFSTLLPLLPGVIRGPDGRLNLKGGRPAEAGLQVGAVTAVDPVTGEWGLDLPPDAIESVEVVPNPYLAEVGRFAAGLTEIETRRGTDAWRVSVNGWIPALRIRDGRVTGVGRWSPRIAVGGPLAARRLYLFASGQFEHRLTRVYDVPAGADELRLRRSAVFVRLDAAVTPRHALTGTVTSFPIRLRYALLDPLNPADSSPTFEQDGLQLTLAERATIGDRVLLDSSFAARWFDVDVRSEGPEPMRLTPEGRGGHYFNVQDRDTRTFQWTQSLTVGASDGPGQHVFKAGWDLVRTTFAGTSTSRPVLVERADGSLVLRMDYAGRGTQRAAATEAAIYVQDRWRASDRLILDAGFRLDRDGVLGRSNPSPRVAASWSLRPDGRAVVRAGAGHFYARTPLNVAAFAQYEVATRTTFAADGRAVVGRETFEPELGGRFKTARSLGWNIEFNHVASPAWLWRVNVLRRRGGRQLTLDPVSEPGRSRLRLGDTGRSRYRELEISVRYAPRPEAEFLAAYVAARSSATLNTVDATLGNIRDPILRPNADGPTEADVPHRLIVRGTWPLGGGWFLSPLVEARSGFPYSVLDESQQVVGARNGAGRFPPLLTIDVAVNRRLSIRGRDVWVGLRAHHLTGTFEPRTVQPNAASPSFGTFSNGIPRRFGITFFISP